METDVSQFCWMPKPLLCGFLALFFAGIASAALPSPRQNGYPEPATLHLTLSRAIQLAMEKNLALKVDAFGPQIAEARTTSELGVFDPELQADFAHDQETRTGIFS